VTFGQTTMLKLERLQLGSSPERVQAVARTGQLWSGVTTSAGVSMSAEKGREILLGDPHEVTKAVSAQRAGRNPASYGPGGDGASLGHLLHGPQGSGPARCRGGGSGPSGGADQATGAAYGLR
jgi:hypothetical protein